MTTRTIECFAWPVMGLIAIALANDGRPTPYQCQVRDPLYFLRSLNARIRTSTVHHYLCNIYLLFCLCFPLAPCKGVGVSVSLSLSLWLDFLLIRCALESSCGKIKGVHKQMPTPLGVQYLDKRSKLAPAPSSQQSVLQLPPILLSLGPHAPSLPGQPVAARFGHARTPACASTTLLNT